jgi:transcriptional regulator with XRE-family HTH domain
MTLDDLAEETGLTKSYLSKVERGQSNPSIAAALRIASALGVDVAQLFSDDAATSRICVGRRSEDTTDRHQPLASAMLGKTMSPFLVRPGRQFAAHPHASHAGQEFIFVHSGSVDLSYDGTIISLDTGDCAYLDASLPHKLRQTSAETPVVIVVAHDGPRGQGR